MNIDKQPKGLGDQIESFTKATGIKKLVEWVFGDGCGCKERKEKLNKLFPRGQKAECLLEDEYKYMKYIKIEERTNLNPEIQKRILKIYNRVFNTRIEYSSCASCWIRYVNELKTVLKAYKK